MSWALLGRFSAPPRSSFAGITQPAAGATAEHTTLARLTLDRMYRAATARALRSPMLRWLHSATAHELVIVPQDLRTPDPSFLDELAAGHFGLAGTIASLAGHSPFALPPPTAAWARELNGFGWLRHFRLAPVDEAQLAARELVADWIACNRRLAGPAIEPAVVARRVISWIGHSDLLLEGSDARTYSATSDSLGAQIQLLAAIWRSAPPGQPRLLCLSALLLASLCVAGGDRRLEHFQRLLLDEIDAQVLPDGGHVSRNPAVPVELLLDLLPLRQCYVAREIAAPQQLLSVAERMIGFLHCMRRGDGALGRFNGMSRTESDSLATVLSYADPPQPTPIMLSNSGYVRLERGDTLILADVGPPPALTYGGEAHAGCLSFEVTVGHLPLLVNCGAPAPAQDMLRSEARATSSHNTLCLSNASSSHLTRTNWFDGKTLSLRGPHQVGTAVREQNGALALEAAHDGYLDDFGVVHTRTLTLSSNGERIAGCDRLGPRSGVLRLKRDLPFAIHFHLPTSAVCRCGGSTDAVDIQILAGSLWRLSAIGARLSIERSRDYAHFSGAQSSMQIVLRGACPGESLVNWVLERITPARQ